MGFFNFNRFSRDESKIINKVDRGLKNKEKDYIPNQKIDNRKTTEEFKDDYTVKLKAEKEQIWGDRKPDFFIDAEGNKIPIDRLNGQTEELLEEAQESINKEADNNERLKQADSTDEIGEETSESAKSGVRAENKDWDHGSNSIRKFYIGHGHLSKNGETVGKKLGLYKDYNPKLNAGAPGNREERYRQGKKAAEKNEGRQPLEERNIYDDLPNIEED